jgi:lysophospholipase L1-like esterase
MQYFSFRSVVLVFHLLVLYNAIAMAQESNVNDSIKLQYKFIKTEKNRLEGDSSSLFPFFDKLTQLEQAKDRKVVVVHIGDSHLQADHYPGIVRVNLQKQFGNAGRGLVAPFKVGRTNEPSNFRTISNTKWHARRIVNEKDSLPIGISGLSIANDDAKSYLKITTLNKEGLDYSFNKVTLFHQKGLQHYNFIVCDSLLCFQANIDASKDTLTEFTTVKVAPANCVIFNIDHQDTLIHKTALIYGLLLENSQPGILYNNVGINGAEYRHYSKNIKLQAQLSLLNPDLILISLGTNEAYAPKYSNTDFLKQVDSLISNLKVKNPDAAFIITTPGDSNKKRKYKNPNNLKAANVLIDYCRQNGLVYWNWFNIMGGTGVINKWALKGLTSKDKLHLSRKGYEIQGALLHAAILKAYQDYKISKSIKP